MDGSLWEMARRYRRIAVALGDDEMKRKVKYVARLDSALGGSEEPLWKPGKGLAAD